MPVFRAFAVFKTPSALGRVWGLRNMHRHRMTCGSDLPFVFRAAEVFRWHLQLFQRRDVVLEISIPEELVRRHDI